MRENREIKKAIKAACEQEAEEKERLRLKKENKDGEQTTVLVTEKQTILVNKSLLAICQMNYQYKSFNLAKVFCDEKLVRAMQETDSLIKKTVGILGSDLIKGALDQMFVLGKMKVLTAKRESLLKNIDSYYAVSRN